MIQQIFLMKIESFLTHMRKAVIMDRETSTYVPVETGMSQDSLDNSIFLYNINDTPVHLIKTSISNIMYTTHF